MLGQALSEENEAGTACPLAAGVLRFLMILTSLASNADGEQNYGFGVYGLKRLQGLTGGRFV